MTCWCKNTPLNSNKLKNRFFVNNLYIYIERERNTMRSALYKLAQSARLPTRYIENCKWKNFLFLILSKNEYCYELELVGFSTFENTFERIGVYAKLAQIFLLSAERKKFFFHNFSNLAIFKKFFD